MSNTKTNPETQYKAALTELSNFMQRYQKLYEGYRDLDNANIIGKGDYTRVKYLRQQVKFAYARMKVLTKAVEQCKRVCGGVQLNLPLNMPAIDKETNHD